VDLDLSLSFIRRPFLEKRSIEDTNKCGHYFRLLDPQREAPSPFTCWI
jgi:hypothetical protein